MHDRVRKRTNPLGSGRLFGASTRLFPFDAAHIVSWWYINVCERVDCTKLCRFDSTMHNTSNTQPENNVSDKIVTVCLPQQHLHPLLR
jgi:hypothetical protein